MEDLLWFVEMASTLYTQPWHGEIDRLAQHWNLFGHQKENTLLGKVHQELKFSVNHSRF